MAILLNMAMLLICGKVTFVLGQVDDTTPKPKSVTYLLMPVYSLGGWAIDQSSPPDPALRHDCNFLPGVPHLPRFRLHVSPPGVSWPSYFPLPLGIPCQCLSCDASCRFSQRVTNPTPFFFVLFLFLLAVDLSWSTKCCC